MRITVNEDKLVAARIRAKIKANGGYCPCSLEKSEDTKCICKDFLENGKEGEYCRCGLYKKIER